MSSQRLTVRLPPILRPMRPAVGRGLLLLERTGPAEYDFGELLALPRRPTALAIAAGDRERLTRWRQARAAALRAVAASSDHPPTTPQDTLPSEAEGLILALALAAVARGTAGPVPPDLTALMARCRRPALP